MKSPSGVFVHEKALVESAHVGAGTRVWAFAHVMPGAVVGRDCNLGDHCYIEGNVRIGDRVTVKNGVSIWDGVQVEDEVFIGPNAVFTNDPNPRAAFRKDPSRLVPTRVRRGATIGANATILAGTTIGEGAFVGAGAVVVRDVSPYTVAVGNPARAIGFVCACGERMRPGTPCRCGRNYRLLEGGGAERTG